MRTYTARYTREGNTWVVLFDEVELSTFGRTLAAARRNARQALAVRLDTTTARLPRVAEVVDIVAGPEAALAAQVVTAREEAERAAATASDRTRRAVRRLRDAGWSLADVADILRITPQAVSKLDRSQRSSPSRAA